MIQSQIKLRLRAAKEKQLNEWLWILTGVHNFAVKKIELHAKDGIYYTGMSFQNILADHGKRIGIPSHTVQGMLSQVHAAWTRCFKKVGGKPRLKGMRNKLNSIPFPDPIRSPDGNYIKLPGIGKLRFHKQNIPAGKIKCGRIVKRTSGWYLCLFVDADHSVIERVADGVIGIDPGFRDLLVTSDGEKIDHPQELRLSATRLAQAQRGKNRKLVSRLHERIKNQRKDRNHKLSLRLVRENSVIVFSKDSTQGMKKIFGRSIASSAHAQLRSMLSYKSHVGDTKYVEVASRNSTRTCSACGSLSGPAGLTGLSVRQWVCAACGTLHDRDINAAINTLIAGVGTTHEGACFMLHSSDRNRPTLVGVRFKTLCYAYQLPLCYASTIPSIYTLYNMPTRPPQSEQLLLRQRRVFAKNFKEARIKAGISQEQLIQKTGLTQSFISNIESVKTNFSLDNASMLAEAVGEPLWKLLTPPPEN